MSSHTSVFQKLNTVRKIGAFAVIFLVGSLLFASFYVSHLVDVSVKAKDRMNVFNTAQQQILNLTLVAMDTIVDRGEGQVQKERLEEMDNAIRTINQDVLSKMESDSDKNYDIAKIRGDIEVLNRFVRVELVDAVERRAYESVFSELDDKIDQQASRIDDYFRKLNAEANEEQLEAFVFAQRGVLGIQIATFVVLIVAIAGIVYMSRFITSEVVRPFSIVSDQMVGSVIQSTAVLKKTSGDLDHLTAVTKVDTEAGAKEISELSLSIQNVTGATEELSSSIQEIRRQINIATEISRAAVSESNQMAHAIGELKQCAEGIGEFTGMINKISESTNLLALNATIEAARAGEAGKGFAVVANEVKILADKTSAATDEISGKVLQIQRAANSAVSVISTITDTINDLSQANATVMAAVDQQSQATQEIAEIMHKTIAGIKGAENMINGVNTALEATKQSSNRVLELTETLVGEAEHSKTAIQNFLHGQKAA